MEWRTMTMTPFPLVEDRMGFVHNFMQTQGSPLQIMLSEKKALTGVVLLHLFWIILVPKKIELHR